MMRVAITGASGYLGSFLAKRLLETDCEVLSITRTPHVLYSRHARFLEILPGDPALPRILSGFKPAVLLHLAAMTSAERCEREPAAAYAANVEYTERLARIAGDADIALIYVSTDLVFDGGTAPGGGFLPAAPLAPYSWYAKTKAQSERIALANPRSCVVRTSLLYGPPIGNRRGAFGWIQDSLERRSPIVLFADEWRTPVFVENAVTCLLRVVETRVSGILHCAGPQRISRVDFGLRYLQALGVTEPPAVLVRTRAEVPSNPPRPEDVSLSIEESARSLGMDFIPYERGVYQSVRKR